MTNLHPNSRATNANFNVRAEAQKQKMHQAATKDAGKAKGSTKPNAFGENRKTGGRKALMNDRAQNGGKGSQRLGLPMAEPAKAFRAGTFYDRRSVSCNPYWALAPTRSDAALNLQIDAA